MFGKNSKKVRPSAIRRGTGSQGISLRSGRANNRHLGAAFSGTTPTNKIRAGGGKRAGSSIRASRSDKGKQARTGRRRSKRWKLLLSTAGLVILLIIVGIAYFGLGWVANKCIWL